MPEALVCIQSSFSAESTRLVSPFLPPKKDQVSGEFLLFLQLHSLIGGERSS